MKNEEDLVSVVIRTKNRPKLLTRALGSVCKQNYSKIEIIVVNDGGKDVSKIIDRYKILYKKRTLFYVKNEASLGRSLAANLGLEKAKGKYICLLDDDDYFLKDHLSKHVAAQKKSSCLWSVSETLESIEDINGLEIERRSGRPYLFNELEFLFFENYFPSNSVVFQEKIINRIGGFDKNLEVFEDWDMWIRMYLEEKPALVKNKTAVYTTREGENNVRTSVKSRGLWKNCFTKIMGKYKNNVYNLKKIDLSLNDIVLFLPNHSEDWYHTKEENKDLKDSWAFKIYKSGFYNLIKRPK